MGMSDCWSYIVGWWKPKTPQLGVRDIKVKGINPNPDNLASKSANAKGLLINPTFNQAYAELLQQLQDSIAETPIDEGKTRESLYLQIRALVLLVTKLNHYAQEYEILIQKQKENEDG